VCKNILKDPRFAPWRGEALRRGYGSSIALPVRVSGKVIGAVNIYAQEPDAFDPEELHLLEELANDVSYGLAALRDRTEREKAEEALVKSSNKIKMFAYSVSHDLKNPAIAIHGLSKRLNRYAANKLDERARSTCDQIQKAAEHIAALVEKINVYIKTKEIPLSIEKVRLKEIVDTVKEEFAPQLIGRQIRWLEPAVIPEVNADRTSMVRILRNLVDNALKYGGHDLSEIRIQLRRVSGQPYLVCGRQWNRFERRRQENAFRALQAQENGRQGGGSRSGACHRQGNCRAAQRPRVAGA
jgi:light-regulated signal transduction histidine kinase (bacteriophytochrome)